MNSNFLSVMRMEKVNSEPPNTASTKIPVKSARRDPARAVLSQNA